jgi:hypothetical protein
VSFFRVSVCRLRVLFKCKLSTYITLFYTKRFAALSSLLQGTLTTKEKDKTKVFVIIEITVVVNEVFSNPKLNLISRNSNPTTTYYSKTQAQCANNTHLRDVNE